ncbi:MAG: hypothetical protein ACTSVV_04955 [Promethearchaeota archaeon]
MPDDDYFMKIPREMANFIENHINENKELGFKTVSQFILHVLREEVKNILEKRRNK